MSNEPGFRSLGSVKVKHAAIAAAASGTRTIVAAVAGKRICVSHYHHGAPGNTTVQWQSFDGTSTYTDLTGVIPPRNGDHCEGSYNPDGHFETLVGEALVAVIGGVAIAGHLTYIEI